MNWLMFDAFSNLSKYDGGIFLMGVCILIASGLFSIYLFKVLIPNSIAYRKNVDAMSRAMVALTNVVEKSNTMQLQSYEMMSCLLRVKRAQVRAFRKLQESTSIDLKEEIGAMLGAIDDYLDMH